MKTIPYFYIIQHIPSGKKYAGARWAQGCKPEELLTTFGYNTSSKIVKSLIESDGSAAFRVLETNTNCDGLHPRDYEHAFIINNNLVNSPNWLNASNNVDPVTGDKHHMKLPVVVSRIQANNQNKYGSNWYMGTDEFYRKTKQTVRSLYGVDNVSQLDSVKQKKKNTLIQNYGSRECAYADMNTKRIETNLTTLGVTNVLSKGSPFKEKRDESVRLKYGVNNVFKLDHVKEKIRKSTLEKYGVDNYAKLKMTCPYCNKTMGINPIKRWHLDKCKMAPHYS